MMTDEKNDVELVLADESLPTDSNQTLPTFTLSKDLIQMAMTSDDGVEKLERLIALEERYNERKRKEAYSRAMNQLQAEMPIVYKKKKGYGYNYAPLEDVVNVAQPIIEKCGFRYEWKQDTKEDGLIWVKCIITHVDGHSEENKLPAMPDTDGAKGNSNKNNVQATVSTVSYLKRVTLINGFGIICGDEDTDGRVQSTLERQQTKSLTLNNLLAQNGKPLVGNAASVRTEKAKTILEIMNSAANLQDLDSVRPMLDGVLDAQDRDHLINLYHQQREGYTNG